MANIIFKRKIYDKMLRWKQETKGTSALLIEGARRIGKSTITQEFAKKEYESHIIIDFANPDPRIIPLFDRIYDLNRFFLELQAYTGIKLQARKSVIIFDEVQFCPKARQSIKYLVADGRYDYIETGSLISIKKNVADILIPSEEYKLNMYPLDFEEFLWATGNEFLFDLIRLNYNSRTPMGTEAHRSAMRDFRLYMLVGGMPQAINAYLASNNLGDVDIVKRSILDLYLNDFRKIDRLGRASAIFSAIPSELSRNTQSFKVGSAIEGAKPSRMGEIFADIADSCTVNMAYQACDPQVGFSLHADLNKFKMFLADTGLLVSLVFMDKEYTDNIIYQKLLSDKLQADLGYIYENVVAQQLASAGHKLFYYTFKTINLINSATQEDSTLKTQRYEIDFLINEKDKITPIEVKSSGYKIHKSLDEFNRKYSSRIKRNILIYTKDLSWEQGILHIPVYMTGLL